MADYEDENEVLVKTESEDSDFVEEEGEAATYVIQWLLCNQKNPKTTKSSDFLLKVSSKEQDVQSHRR